MIEGEEDKTEEERYHTISLRHVPRFGNCRHGCEVAWRDRKVVT